MLPKDILPMARKVEAAEVQSEIIKIVKDKRVTDKASRALYFDSGFTFPLGTVGTIANPPAPEPRRNVFRNLFS